MKFILVISLLTQTLLAQEASTIIRHDTKKETRPNSNTSKSSSGEFNLVLLSERMPSCQFPKSVSPEEEAKQRELKIAQLAKWNSDLVEISRMVKERQIECDSGKAKEPTKPFFHSFPK